MVKVSHEVPFSLLEKSREFNDYDYCLPHLLDQNEEYKNFFYESKAMGRYIIMDNSLHELGEAYDTDRLMYWVNEIKPNEFIIPDVWEDKPASVRNATIWSQVQLPKETTKVAVVQASNETEAIECFESYLTLDYEKIAFSYGAAWYTEVCPHPNKDLSKAMGRVIFVNNLYSSHRIPEKTRLHLLGTASPIEFGMYSNIPNLETIDTSNPIMASLEGLKYHDLGLDYKPTADMNNFQDIDIKDVDMELIEFNTKAFKSINNL